MVRRSGRKQTVSEPWSLEQRDFFGHRISGRKNKWRRVSTFPFAKFIFQGDSRHKIDLQMQVYFAVWRKVVSRNASLFGEEGGNGVRNS